MCIRINMCYKIIILNCKLYYSMILIRQQHLENWFKQIVIILVEFNLICREIIYGITTLLFFDFDVQDVSKLTALSREVISRQATINIGE